MRIRGSRRLFCLPDFKSIAHVSAHQKKTRKASLGFMIAICLLAGAFSLFQILSKVLNSKADSAPTISAISPTSGSIDGGTNVTVSGTNLLTGNDSYSKLLLHNDGTGASFVDSSSGAKSITANGNATQSTAQSKFGGSSAHFGGDGDYLSVPDSDDWNFGSDNFTVDFWVRLSNVNTYQPLITQDSNVGTRSWLILANNSTLIWTVPNGTQTTADCLEANTWIHLAVVRNGTVVTIYKNGVSVGSHDYGAGYNIPDGTMPLEIGRQGAYGYGINDGYIDELRISKGLARWTSDFTPSSVRYGSTNITIGGNQGTNISITDPTTATMTTPAHAAGAADVVVTNDDSQSATLTNGFTFLEPAPTISSISPDNGLTSGGTSVSISGSNFFYGNDSSAKLLLHADGSGASFSDSSASAKSITANGNVTQSAVQSKFGGKSAYFDGNGDYLTASDSDDWNFGSGNFTIDFWIKTDAITNRAILGQWVDIGNFWRIASDGSDFFVQTSSGGFWVSCANSLIGDNVLHHIAVVRNGNSLTLYVDGVARNTQTNSNTWPDVATTLNIGYYAGTLNAFSGYFDELRISKGIARWTSNFTPPTNRYGSTNVTIGGNQATNVMATDSTTITATTPAHAAGDVDVVVTNDDSQSATLSNGFTYHNIPAPTISSINPTSGPSVGGTNIEISGTGLGLDDDASTKLLIHGDGSGTSISDFSPISKTITANGNATQSATQSKFGGSSGYFDGTNSSLSLPASTDFDFGTGDFSIDTWVYLPSSTAGYVFSCNGANGNWNAYPGGCALAFGDNSFGFMTPDSNWISTTNSNSVSQWHHLAVVRSGNETNNIKLYLDGNLAAQGTYVGQIGSSLSIPAIGQWDQYSGGRGWFNGYIDELRVSKGIAHWTSDFTPSTTPYAQPNVTFGGTSATDLKLASPANIFATTPAHADGTVDVTVTNDDSQSATLSNAFTFVTPPTITSITPSSGSTIGGDSVTISGSNFVDTPDVTFGGTDATSVNRVDSNTLSVVVPAHNIGTVDVVVTNPDNQEATLVNGFTYTNTAPTVSSITPVSGPTAGGTSVTISGTNFIPQNTGGDTGWAVVSGKTLPTTLYGASQAVVGDYIYLFGGYNGSTVLNTIYRAPVSDPTTWTIVAGKTLPSNLCYSQLAVIGDNLYLFGGSVASATNVIYTAPISDPTSWIDTGKTLPGNLRYSQLAVIGDNVYLFGGYAAAATNVIYSAPVSDPTTWVNTGKLLPGNLYNSQLSVIGDNVYLFGGYAAAATNVIYSALVSDPTTWANTGKLLPGNLYFSQLAVIGDNLYLFGGHNGSAVRNGIYKASVSDPTTWTTSSGTLSSALYVSTSAVIGNYVYLFGGINSAITNAIYRAPLTHNRSNVYNKSWLTDWQTISSDQSRVTIGGVQATNISVVNQTTITATTPAHVAGQADVTVTNYDGQFSTLSNAFTFINPPTISAISPNSSLKTGGDTVTITGTDFYGTPTVSFGGTNSSSVTFVDSNTLSVVVPAHSVGTFDVTVTNSDSQSVTLTSGFTFTELAPTVSSISPASGPTAGGTSVTISGTNFYALPQCDANTVSLWHWEETSGSGAYLLDSCNANNGTPTGTVSANGKNGKARSLNGTSDYVTVANNANFNFSLGQDFTIEYWAKIPATQPNTVITSNSIFEKWSNSGGYPFVCRLLNQTAGANAGKISCGRYNGTTGSGVTSGVAVNDDRWHHVAFVKSGTALLIYIDGGLSGSSTDITTGTTTNTSPLYFGRRGGSGYYFKGLLDEIRISNVGRTSTEVQQIYQNGSASVRFGSTDAENIYFVDSNTIVADTPTHEAGLVDLTISNPDGQSSTLSNAFAYVAPPTITSITPNSSLKTGGDTVMITGTDFYGTPTVSFGGISSSSTTLMDPNTLSVVVPAHDMGTFDVVVTNPDGQFSTLADGFTFNELIPTVSSITPTSGPAVGGTNVTISGTNFVQQNSGGASGWGIVSGKNLPGALYGGSLAVIGDYVYLFGGYNSSNAVTNIIYRAPVSDPTTWTNTGKNLPISMGRSSIAVIGEYVYMFGGYNGSASINAIYRASVSDPTTWSIVSGKTLPAGLYGSSLQIVNGNIYLFGGNTATNAVTNVIYSAPVSDPTTWTNTGKTLPGNLAYYACANINGTLYSFNGATGNGGANASNIIYSASASDPTTWIDTGKTMPVSLTRESDQLFVIGSKLYLLGGWSTTSASSVNTILSANISDPTSWSVESATLPAVLSSPRISIVDGYFYAFGGYTNTPVSNIYRTSISHFRPNVYNKPWLTNWYTDSNLFDQSNVTIGGQQAASINFTNSTTITATTPANTVGAKDVTVTNYDGQSSTLTNAFTYINPPTITSITPNSSLKTGGDTITITGTDFYGTPIVSFGGTNSSSVTFVDSNTLSVVVPAHDVGTFEVVVINPDGQSVTLPNSFAFLESAPTISSVSPTAGPAVGGTSVTITGTNFITGDFGNGSDGNVTISANKNINTDTIATGRTCADAVNYSVTALTSRTATLSATPAAGCFVIGDEILLMSLKGVSSNYANVGNYETLKIQSVDGNIITFMTGKTKYYGNNTNDDTNIGTATTNQRVMLQRVPNYQNVTIDSGITLTANGWDGTRGGILFFKANGTVANSGTITMNGKGFAGGGAVGARNQTGYQGGSYAGDSVKTNARNFSGSGGGVSDGWAQCGAGSGGGHANAGSTGVSDYTSGTPGDPIGTSDLSTMFLGSGGGSGGTANWGTCSAAGGAGAGAVYIVANGINSSGTISANGIGGGGGYHGGAHDCAPGGGGAGGSIYLSANSFSTNTVTATGGSGGASNEAGIYGGAGSVGRIRTDYLSNAPVTNPIAHLVQQNFSVSFGGILATNLQLVNPTTVIATTPVHVPETVDVTVANYDGQSATLSGSYTFNPPPEISAITPNSSLKTGGNIVTITGIEFKGSPTVKFGSVAATSVTLVDANTLSVVVPAHTSGTYDVTVTNPDGQVSVLTNGFTFTELAPAVSSITPTSGPTAGGTNVTISGTNFTTRYVRAITINNADVALTDFQVSFIVDSATLVSSGKMRSDGGDIRIFDSNGTTKLPYWIESGINTASTKIWVKVPSLPTGSKVLYLSYGDLEQASEANGEQVFDFFDGFDGSSVDTNKWNVVNSTGFSVSGGNLNGSNTTGRLLSNQTFSQGVVQEIKTRGATLPTNGYAPGGFYVNSGDQICWLNHPGNAYYRNDSTWINTSSQTPASNMLYQVKVKDASTVNLSMTNLDTGAIFWNVGDMSNVVSNEHIMIGTRGDDLYTGQGYAATWDWVRIRKYAANEPQSSTGDEQSELSVSIDSVPATNTSLVNSTTITATVPAHIAGPTDVTVTNYDGQSSTLTSAFTYINPPTVTSIFPNNPTNNQSRNVTIIGQDFQSGATIKFTKAGQTDIACTNPIFINTATLNCNADFHGVEPGAWIVAVTNADGQSVSNDGILNIIGEVTQIKFATAPLTIKPDTASSGIRIALADISGREIPSQSNAIINLETDSTTGSFSLSRNDWQPITQVLFSIGDSSKNIYYKDATLGTFNLSAQENPDNGWTDDSQEITISKNAPYTWPFDEQADYTYDSQITEVVNSYAQLKDLSGSVDLGTGSDGNVTISANKNINTDTIATGRTCADAINYSVSALTSNTATLSTTPAAGCLTAGDEILLVNLQGTSGNYINVGNYETIRIDSVAGNIITFTGNKTKYYGNNSNDDSNIGTATTNQRVMLQRVPNYQDITINSGVTLTANAWDGTKGGVLYFKASGSITNDGTIDMNGKGFRGGAWCGGTSSGCMGYQGESYGGVGIKSYNANLGGGGGGHFNGAANGVGYGGNAGYANAGSITSGEPSYTYKGMPGSSYGIASLEKIYLGSGGGGASYYNYTGGYGGGIISISTNNLETNGSINANGTNASSGYAGDGSGGSVLFGVENQATLGASLVSALKGGESSDGRIALNASQTSTVSGTTIPAITVNKYSLNIPIISNVSSVNLSYSELTSFTEDLGPQNQGNVKYQLSNDGGITWYWWNGSTWTATTQGVAQANDATTINSHATTFHTQSGQVGVGQLSFRAYLISSGIQQTQLDSINVGYKIYPYRYVFTQVPSSLSETEAGAFVVQGQDQNGNVMSVTQDTTLNLATSTPATGKFAVDLMEDESTRWDHTSVAIPEGSSSAMFYYTDALKGDKTITATSSDGNPSIAATIVQHIKSRYRFLVTGISDPVHAGVASSVTVNATDYLGNPTTDYTGTVHFSSTDAAAILPANFTFTTEMLGGHTFVNGVTMMTQGEWTVDVTDASDSDITGMQTDITVTEPLMGTPSKLVITTDRQYVPVSTTSSPITVQLQDNANSPAARAVATTLYVSHTSATGQLSTDGITWNNGTLTAIIPAGATSINIYFKDSALGSYVLSVSDDAAAGEDFGLTNTTQDISVTAGSPASFELSGVPVTLEAGMVSGPINVTLKDVVGNTVSTFNDQSVYLTSTTGGEFSPNGTDSWVSTYNQTLISGQSGLTIYYRNTSALGDTIAVSDTDPANGDTGLVDDSANVNVTSGEIFRYSLVGTPSGLVVGQASPNITIQAYDQYGNVAVATQDQEIYLYSSDANTRFSESSSPFTEVSSVIMGAGTTTATFSTRQDVNTGSITITASDSAAMPDGNNGIIDATQTVNISAGNVTNFALVSTNPVSIGAGEESQPILIESRNAYGVKTPLAADTVVYFHTDSTAATKEFSLNPGGGWSALAQTTMAAGSDTMTVYYKDTQAGSHALTIGDDATIAQDDGITNVQLTANVTAGVPVSLDITSAPFNVEAGTLAGPIMIYLKDQYGNTAVATSNIAVDLAADNAGLTFYDQENNATNSVTIVNGTTNVSFNARSYEQQTYDVSVQASGLIQDNQQFTVNWGSPHSIAFIQSVANSVAGNISGPFTVELRNSHGVRVNAAAPTTINLSNSRAGAFGADSGASFDGSFVASVIETGQAQTSFYYRATASGTHILTTQGTGLNYAEVSHSVAAANVTNITFAAGEQTIVKENVSSVYALISRDQFGNEAAVGANEDITLSSDSAQAEFSRTQSPWNATLVTTINAGQSRANFYYKDYVSGVHHIEAVSQFNATAQNVNVIDAPVHEVVPTKYRFQGGAQTFIVNNEATFGFFLADNSDNYAEADREITATVVSDSVTGQFYDVSSESWNSSLSVIFAQGETIKSFKYRDSAPGNPAITISGDGLASAAQQQTVENGNIEKITVTGASAANTTDRIALAISLRTNTDLLVRTNQDVQINLFSDHAQGRFYASASSNSPINSTMIYTGSSQKVVYFQKTVPGDVHLTISESPEKGWADATKDISITAQGTHLRFVTSAQTKVAGTESDVLGVQLQDYYGNVVQAQTDIVLHISSTSSFARFSRENGSNWSNTSEITLASGTDTASFYATDTAAGTHAVTVSDVSAPAENPDTGIVNATQNYIVSAAQAHSIALLSGATQNLLAGQTSAPITVQLHDQYGNARTVQTDTRLYISASSTNALFSLTNDFSPSHLIESFLVPAGSSVATFYFKDTVVEHVTISISSEDPTIGTSEGIFGILSAFADEVDLIGAQAEMEVTMGDPARLIWESLPVQQQAGDDSVTAVVKLTNQYSVEMPAPNDIPVYFSTSSSEGEFALVSAGPWNAQLAGNIQEGESRLTVYYRDTQVGSPLLTASDVSTPAEDPDADLSNATGYVDVVFGNPTKIVFTSSPQTIIANHESTQMRVQLQNSFDVPAPVTSDTLVYLRSSSTRGTFSTDGATWGINGVLVHSGQDQATFFYRDPIADTPMVTAADSLPLTSDTGLTNATQQQIITAQVIDRLHVTNISDPQYQGTPSSMVVRALDSEGYVVETYDGTLTEVKAYDSTDTEETAILPEMPYVFQPDTDRGIKTFTNAVSFLQNGEKKVTVEDNQGHTGQQENITVTTPPAGIISSLKFIDPNSTLSVESDKRSQLITLQLQNEDGEPWNATEDSGFRIRITSSSDKGTFSDNGTDWNDTIELVVPKNLNYASFYYHDTKSGSFELLATDWEGSLDNEDIENDTLEGTTAPDVAVTFALSGNNTQNAGEAQNLNIIARDINGNVATGYTGVKTVTLSGASTSPSGKKATCKNSSNDAVEFGLPTDLEFSAGVAVCELDLFASELTEIEATDGTITTIDNQDQDLNVTVSPNVPHIEQSVLSASPNPQMISSPVRITVAPKDRYGNVSVDSTKELIAMVSGANTVENLTLTFNETSKLYETTYAPTLPGVDLIRVKLEGANIQKDTEGSNDGTFHETVEGEIIEETSCIEKLSVDSYNSDSFILAVCIRASDEAQSDKIDRSKNGDSDIYQLTLEADSSEDLEGKLEFTSYAQEPDSHELDDRYTDSDKYDAYKYFRARNDFVSGKIKSATIAMRISKSWIDEQNMQNITAVRLDSSDNFSMSRTGTESADYYVYQFDVSDPDGYWAIMGEKGTKEESQEVAQIDQPQQPVQPIQPIQEQIQLQEEGPSEEEHETLQQVFSSPIDTVFADIISSNDPQQLEEAKRIANVVAGTAATAAAIPMLPNILGLARMLSAMPLKRRKKWGIVYDADSGEPVAHALISIIGSDGRVKEVKTTDQNGSYFFNARAGAYTLEAFKEGYEALSNVHSDSFHTFYGQSYDRTDVVALREDGIVSVNVPLHIEEKSSDKELFSKSVLMHAIFWAGFIISGFALILHPGALNLAVFAVFAVNFVVNTFIFPTLKGSKITDANGLAVPFASVKIFDLADGKLVMRTTTNEKGVFAAILSPGEYELQVDAGTKNLKMSISTKHHKELRKNIELT